jgi:hypothetical protein
MINEDLVEQAALAILQDQGIPYLGADVISPDGTDPERASHGEVLLMGRLEAAVARLNPRIPEDARRDAIRQITGAASQSLTEENRRIQHGGHALAVQIAAPELVRLGVAARVGRAAARGGAPHDARAVRLSRLAGAHGAQGA